MGDHIDRQPHRVAQFPDQLIELSRTDRVKAGCRLVQKNDIRIKCEGARKSSPLDHAAREFGWVFRCCIAWQTDKLKLQIGQLIHQRARQVEIFTHRHLDVLEHRQR